VKVRPILAGLHEVANVVQEGGDDDLVVGTVMMREGSALQRMSKLGDRFAIGSQPALGEETDEVEPPGPTHRERVPARPVARSSSRAPARP
jgi:hypothetical protein